MLSRLQVAILLGALGLLFVFFRRNKYPYPPGPKGLPVFGNIFDVPLKGQWIAFAKMSKELNSPIISVNMLGTRIVILNDMKTIEELFERRANIYSERPRLPLLNEAAGFNWNWGFSSNKALWKACRKEFVPHFRQVAARQYRPLEVSMAHGLIKKILKNPDDFYQSCRYMTGSLILEMTYGMKVQLENDPYIEIAEKGSEGLERSVSASNLVDMFPWLQHIPVWMSRIPGLGWRADVEEYKRMGFEMRDAPYDWLQEQLKKGTASPCLTTVLADQIQDKWDDPQFADTIIRSLSGTLYVGGSDTTVGVIRFVILLMVLHPDVQAKAHAELDRVVGSERLPEFSDEANLPYVTAIMKEILRWAAPVTLAHATAADDVYKGFFIPKGTMVAGNSWALLHSAETYEDPDRFWPERYLDAEGKLNNTVPDAMKVAFGYGTRVCPGRFQAVDTAWIAAACILAVFDISPAEGADGKVMLPSPEPDSGIVNHPLAFQCNIKPRSKRAEELIRNAGMPNVEG